MNAVTKTPQEQSSTTVAVGPVPDDRNIHQRLLDVMREVSYIQKDRKIPGLGGGYSVVTHDAVTAAVRPALVKHGVIYYPQNLTCVQNGNRTEMQLDIKFVNAAKPDDFILVPSLGYGIDAQDKGPGKAVSYAVKMALLKALGLETGEDADDGTTATHAPAAKTTPAKPAAPEVDKVKNAPGVSEAKVWVRNHIHDLSGSGNPDEFMEHITAAKARWIRICSVYPNVWTGPDGTGLRGEAMKIAANYECRTAFDLFLKEVEGDAANYQQEAAQ